MICWAKSRVQLMEWQKTAWRGLGMKLVDNTKKALKGKLHVHQALNMAQRLKTDENDMLGCEQCGIPHVRPKNPMRTHNKEIG